MHTSMNVVVASPNPVNISAVREAFSQQFPSAGLELIPVDVESGVSDQPESDNESRRGAKNRVEEARRAHPRKRRESVMMRKSGHL